MLGWYLSSCCEIIVSQSFAGRGSAFTILKAGVPDNRVGTKYISSTARKSPRQCCSGCGSDPSHLPEALECERDGTGDVTSSLALGWVSGWGTLGSLLGVPSRAGGWWLWGTRRAVKELLCCRTKSEPLAALGRAGEGQEGASNGLMVLQDCSCREEWNPCAACPHCWAVVSWGLTWASSCQG